MQNSSFKILLGVLFFGGVSSLSFILTGCVPVAIFGVGAATVDLATQERGISGTFNDTDIRAQINNLWFKKSVELYSHVLLSVQDGYVLLTGTVANEDDRLEAIKLAWQARGVKNVFNEIKIGPPQSVEEGLDDTWISTKVRSGLIFDEHVHSTNYSVTTFDGVVYLMGIALSQEDLDAAILVAKDTRGVKNVVSHVVLKEPEEGPSEASQTSSPASQETETETRVNFEPEGEVQLPRASSQIEEETLAPPL